MLEKQFQEKVKEDLRLLPETYFLKTQERGRRGVPDILACIRGKFVAIELKAETGRLAPIQKNTLEKIAMSGGIAFVAKPSTWEMQLRMLSDLASVAY
jgi:hypothetical protein